MSRPIFISLGAGVQSSTMLLMACAGELEEYGSPEAAIFADTGWEPPAVYDWLSFLEAEVAGRIEIVRVSRGNLRDDYLDGLERQRHGGKGPPPIPLHVRGGGRPRGQMWRQCTNQYKLKAIFDEIRRRGYGGRKGEPVEQWIGISFDEIQRMKPSRVPWARAAWPLIERRMTRHDCKLWMSRHGYPEPPKSACIACPYHSNPQWREIKADAGLWADAVAFDRAIRKMPQVEGELFVHYSGLPLEEVDLRTPEDFGQMDLFGAECEGMCGV